MESKIRVGVVGVGYLGQHHARIYNELEDADLIGVCDIDEKRGKEIADKYNTKYFQDYKGIYDKVSAVSIATPTNTHYDIASYFLNRGVDTLVEKPITNTPENAEELISLSDKNSCILQVGHIERYNPAVKKASEYINNPKFIEVNRLSAFPSRSLDIGVVLDLMIHDIDVILSFVKSPIKSINSIGASVFSDKEDIANSRIEFDNGCVSNITASRISYKSERKFRVFQPSSYLSLDYEKQEFVLYRKKKQKVKSPSEIEKIIPQFEKTEPLREEIQDFINCISRKRKPKVSGYHGLTALRVALEISNKI
ncbi:MAG: Gfo/Idh/MocA family protein [Elusimicrobiota bacterium]